MPTLWEIVTGNSTLPDNGINTFWDHINNQEGGGGGEPYPIYYKDIEVKAEVPTISIGVNTPRIDVEKQNIGIDTGSDPEIDVPSIIVEAD